MHLFKLFPQTLLYILLSVYGTAQIKKDTPWTSFKVINTSKSAKVFNILFHYSKEHDSTWIISYFPHRNDYLLPGARISSEIQSDSLQILYFTYDVIIEGQIFHKRVDTLFTVKGNNTSAIKINDFYIARDWQDSLWFKSLMTFFILVFLWLILKYINYLKLRKKNKSLVNSLAIQKERMRISNEMHDDIGAGLFGLTLQTEILKDQIHDSGDKLKLESIHKSISDLSTKLREVIWELNTENDNLHNLISFIHRQAHRMFENSGILLSVQSAENIPNSNITGEKRKHIFLAVQEGLVNILKHAEATITNMNFSYSLGSLSISIQDNGNGISTVAKSPESMGLKTMKARVDKLEGIFKYHSDTNGTCLNITVPI